MRLVFSCVASRNTQRVFYWPGGREKAGRLFAVQPPTKVRPCAHPLEALQNPGWSAQRHRRGRAMQSIANGSAKFSVRSLTAFFLPQPPRRGERAGRLPIGRPAILAALERPPLAMAEKQLNQTRPLSKCPAFSHFAANRDRRSRESPPPHAARATFTSFTSSSAGGNSSFKKQSQAARLGKFFRFNSSLKQSISLLRRGARDFSLHFATQTQQKPLWGRAAPGRKTKSPNKKQGHFW